MYLKNSPARRIVVANHAPLHVVETFGRLEALHLSRIDLGRGLASAARQRALTLIGCNGASSAASRRFGASLVSTTPAVRILDKIANTVVCDRCQ